VLLSLCNLFTLVAEPKTVEFIVDIAESQPREILFFDRFAVFRRQNFIELHFGFFGDSPDLLSGLIINVQSNVLDDAKKSFIDFIGLGGNVPEPIELPAFKIRHRSQVLAADLVGLARHRAMGEITFHTLSWKVGIDLAQSSNKPGPRNIEGYFAALLRCNLELQKRWVLAVYDTNENED
jgi:hypothetical protein